MNVRECLIYNTFKLLSHKKIENDSTTIFNDSVFRSI